jgi:uncharacterized membrane protein (DUF485 family)
MSDLASSAHSTGAARPSGGATVVSPDGVKRAVTDTPRTLLDSREFKELVSRRWRTSLVLTALLFLIYYGYILLIATNRPLLSVRVGETTTLGIPLGASIIVAAWVLTAAYVVWANRHYDPEVKRLRDRLD